MTVVEISTFTVTVDVIEVDGHTPSLIAVVRVLRDSLPKSWGLAEIVPAARLARSIGSITLAI